MTDETTSPAAGVDAANPDRAKVEKQGRDTKAVMDAATEPAQPESQEQPPLGDDDGDKKPKSRAAERIQELNRRFKEERRRAEEAERRLRELEQNRTQLASPLDYESEEEYYRAQVSATKDAVREELLRENAERAKEQAHLARVESWNARVSEFRERAPDFDDVAYRTDVTISEPMAAAIMDSDIGPQISYYLGKNPQEARRIYAMEPLSAAREIGRLEHRLSMAAAKQTTTAPPPPKTITGANSGAMPKPLQEMSMDEYFVARRRK